MRRKFLIKYLFLLVPLIGLFYLLIDLRASFGVLDSSSAVLIEALKVDATFLAALMISPLVVIGLLLFFLNNNSSENKTFKVLRYLTIFLLVLSFLVPVTLSYVYTGELFASEVITLYVSELKVTLNTSLAILIVLFIRKHWILR